MRPTDAMALRSLTAESASQEVTAPNWPKTPPENRHVSVVGLLSSLILPTRAARRIGVASERDGLRGIVVARARASGLVWDVQHLVGAESGDACVGLLRWVCQEATKEGARRVFLETAEEGIGIEIAYRGGFERCTRGTVYQLDAGFDTNSRDTFPARPRLRSDEMGLFQLYNAVVPAGVRAAEALTYEEWAALHRGAKPWAPSVIGEGQDYVWEMGSRAVGWMRIVFGERAQYFTLLIHPHSESFAERMVRDALAQLSSKVPVLVDVREYQAAAQEAVERVGFSRRHDYIVWVRQLAQRVVQPAVKAIRAQPTPSV